MELARNGKLADLLETGAIVKTAFCGPCFGAGDTPANNGCTFHCSNRSKQGIPDRSRRVHRNIHEAGIPLRQEDLREPCLRQQGCGRSVCRNPVRTEHQRLAGYAAACREPDSEGCFGLAEFTLSRKDPAYVGRAKEVQVAEKAIQEGNCPAEALPELKPVFAAIHTQYPDIDKTNVGVGSTIFAVKPGDGSAREQAASCQKVLGGWANIANEYATKRYRSNLINWGMLPFLIPERDLPFTNGDYIFVPEIRKAVEEKADVIKAYVVKDGALVPFEMTLGALTDDEREIIRKGCLINYYRG